MKLFVSSLSHKQFYTRFVDSKLDPVPARQWHALYQTILGPNRHKSENRGEGEPERKREGEGREGKKGRLARMLAVATGGLWSPSKGH